MSLSFIDSSDNSILVRSSNQQKKLYIILRGHIRNSFKNRQLYDYIKSLSQEYDLTIYIQTWSILQTNVSWRHLEKNESPVNEELIYQYFEELSKNIEKIIILDDSKIKLTGKTTGRMGRTSGSYLGWKQMWYGIYEIGNYVDNTDIGNDCFVINTRFDVFDNSVSFSPKTIDSKLKKLMKSNKSPETLSKNIFLKEGEFFGMDNFYIGNKKTIFTLAHRFKYNLDDIVIKYPGVTSHEFYTFHVNNSLFLDNWLNLDKRLNEKIVFEEVIIEPLLKFSNESKRTNEKFNFGERMVEPLLKDHNENKNVMLKPLKSGISKPPLDLTSVQISDTVKTNELSNVTILSCTSKNKGSKIGLYDSNPSETDISIELIESSKLPILACTSKTKGSKIELHNSNPSAIDNSNDIVEQPPSLTLISSQPRNNKMDLFDPIDSSLITANRDYDESSSISALPSSHNRNGSIPLFDSNSIVSNSSIILPDPAPLLTLTSSQSRNNKIVLFDSNSDLTINIPFNESNQNLTLTTAAQSRNHKMSVLESTIPVETVSCINNDTSNQSQLVASGISRKGSVSLIDTLANDQTLIQMKASELTVRSTASRTVKPLFNTDVNENLPPIISGDSRIVLSKKNSRNNATPLTFVSSSDNNKESKEPVYVPEVIKPAPEIKKSAPEIKKPAPEIVIDHLKIIDNDNDYKTNIIKTQNKNVPHKKASRFIKTPVPISKFSVSLDPSFIKGTEPIEKYSIRTGLSSSKLVHENKFKVNTKTLADYYALLSN